ncbi:MAG TPA: DNA polymerase III subunit gamma/tau [Hydrogenophaga sp.]|uniref:DNA polymerase III subunit gamma/tau n=1 Tax=Hydrogenophaga sp. TaxID=1904254 RepID=UPI002C5E1247|nr:DNA polymerase III subunit gamma/tau [Hydrogenophaga sp.]HMN92381.1 DNA polymerase III subunit gamma/tau [Hydrogenophaga sp.]HMP10607.1 DNA polymerase III subunit gamma/tau [Hydrogenophaga sp.]
MSYVVLARKYRPRHFAEMVGQSHVVQALSNALGSQRLHHAYLFTGTRGVGKTTVSRILAKSLNCVGADGQGGITAEPCGVCEACRDIDAGRFVDYTELDAASNRGVDEVQALLEQAVYKPVQGRFKVFMIDEVHMLTNTAFNAMLKTLEEPPEYLKFVLATTDPQKVPVTVLSRCLQFNLRPMAPETVQEHLARVLEAESVPADPGALRLIARAARGSMRDALSLTDQAIAFGAGRLQEPAVREMLGAVDRSHVFRLIEALAAGEGSEVVSTVDALREHGLSASSTLEEMTGLLQRMAVIQAVGRPVAADDPDEQRLAALAAVMPADETQLLYSLCLHGRAELGLAPDEYAGLTMVLLRLLAFKPAGAVAEKKSLKSAPEAPSQATEPRAVSVGVPPLEPSRPGVGADSAVGAPAVAAPAVDIAIDVTDADLGSPPPWHDEAPPEVPTQTGQPANSDSFVSIPVRDQPPPRSERDASGAGLRQGELVVTPEGNFWNETVTALVRAEAVTALVRELALQSQLVSREGGVWTLQIPQASLGQAQSSDRLQTALVTLGHEVRLALRHGPVSDSPALRAAAESRRRQDEAERLILADPFVQTMMRDFGGKIVPGSLRPGDT